MAEILVNGGNRLQGEIPVSGAKNAALPLMAQRLRLGRAAVVVERGSVWEISSHESFL